MRTAALASARSLLLAAAAVLLAVTSAHADSVAPAPASLVPAEWPASTAANPACAIPAEFTRLTYPLARAARLLADHKPVKIVAVGSSSTAGAGASSPMASYPSRLAGELTQKFPLEKITVVNRGRNGEEAQDMLARFEAGVIGEKPDLVLWQLGTNRLLREHPLSPAPSQIAQGVARLKAAGADVILIDPQFAPKVIAKKKKKKMVDLLEVAAETYHVNLFRRFALMRYWREGRGMDFASFLSRDQLHMNDWSYACLAKALGAAIAEAATRPIASASAQPAR